MKWILSISSCRQKGPDFPLFFPAKESPVRYTPYPPMTALTSLLLTSLVPLGSTGEVIWLPPNFEVQVVAGGFVSMETDGRAPGSGTWLFRGKRPANKLLKAQYCCALPPHCLLATAVSCSIGTEPCRGCVGQTSASPRGQGKCIYHPGRPPTASFIVIISALRHRRYCLSWNLAHFPHYQQAVRGSSFLWKVKGN